LSGFISLPMVSGPDLLEWQRRTTPLLVSSRISRPNRQPVAPLVSAADCPNPTAVLQLAQLETVRLNRPRFREEAQ
jgi:hypothetical protein